MPYLCILFFGFLLTEGMGLRNMQYRAKTAVLSDGEMVRRNVELEASLINDLLDIARITGGKLQLHLKNAQKFTPERGITRYANSPLRSRRTNRARPDRTHLYP